MDALHVVIQFKTAAIHFMHVYGCNIMPPQMNLMAVDGTTFVASLWLVPSNETGKELYWGTDILYRVCHGFRLTNGDDYFWDDFDHFWR